jgi:sugar lactone lactonase YvrE
MPASPVLTVPCADRLGEGPFWAAGRGKLYWFDIKSLRLHWWDPVARAHGGRDLPFQASAGAEDESGGLLLATTLGLVRLDPDTGDHSVLVGMPAPEGFRTNDGKIDVLGRFWWSHMDDDEGLRPGRVFRTDPDGRTDVVLEDIAIPNTLAYAPGGELYVSDSKLRRTMRYAVTPEGRLERPTDFIDLTCGPGTPDGGALDEEGCLWNAQWGAGRVVRYRPDGAIDRIVPMPVNQPTSCAFGGRSLDILFVTSAREGLAPDELAGQPDAGGLFQFEPGVRGLALPVYGSREAR